MGYGGCVLCLLIASSLMTFSVATIRGRTLREDSPCSEQGFYRDDKDCSKFYRCAELPLSIGNQITKYEFQCPAGTIFDESISTCNYPSQMQNPPAECLENGQIIPPTTAGSQIQQQNPGKLETTLPAQGSQIQTPILVPGRLYYNLPQTYFYYPQHPQIQLSPYYHYGVQHTG